MITFQDAPSVVKWPLRKHGGPPLPEWLSVDEAAAKSGYHANYIRRLIRAGEIKAEKKGLMWWVDPDSLAAFVSKMKALDDGRAGPKSDRGW